MKVMCPGRYILITSLGSALLFMVALLLVGKWEPAANPAPLSPGHKGLECSECHGAPTDIHVSMNAMCEGCHASVLDERRAHSTAYLDIVGRRNFPWHVRPDACLDCHNGHVRSGDGLNSAIPADHCMLCHADLVIEEGYHEGLGFDTCVSCHQYHGKTLRSPRSR